MTTRANLYVDQGADFSISLAMFDPSDASFDITGKTFYGSVKKLYSSSVLFELDFVINNNVPTNEVVLLIDRYKTEEICAGKYQYDVVMYNVNGTRIKVLEGLLFITPTITELY
jgi:hypothetical protein